MAISKYICRCGNRTDKLTSYFINGIRVTVCNDCAEIERLNKTYHVAIDYELVKNDLNKNIIDTREK